MSCTSLNSQVEELEKEKTNLLGVIEELEKQKLNHQEHIKRFVQSISFNEVKHNSV